MTTIEKIKLGLFGAVFASSLYYYTDGYSVTILFFAILITYLIQFVILIRKELRVHKLLNSILKCEIAKQFTKKDVKRVKKALRIALLTEDPNNKIVGARAEAIPQ